MFSLFCVYPLALYTGRDSSQVMKTVQTLKTNVIGLGSYINSVNRELHSYTQSTDKSLAGISGQIDSLSAKMNLLEDDLQRRSVSSLKRASSADETLANALKSDVASLSEEITKVQRTLRSDVLGMSSNLEGLKVRLEDLEKKLGSVMGSLSSVNTDLLAMTGDVRLSLIN